MAGALTMARLAIMLAAALGCVIVGVSAAHSQIEDKAAALDAEVIRLYRRGKYAEATEIAKQALAAKEKAYGPEHLEVATSLNNLALLYQELGRYADAEPLYMKSLATREKMLGPNHAVVGLSLNNLA